MILKLVLKSLLDEKVRLLTAVLGVSVAVGLVVWSLGLAVTAAGQSRSTVRRMTEPYGCWVSAGGAGMRRGRRPAAAPAPPRGGKRPETLAPELTDAVRNAPDVISVTACKTVRATLDHRPGGRVMQGPPLTGVMTLADAGGCPYTRATVTGKWPDPRSEEAEAAVCSAVFTPRKLSPPPVGSTLVLLTASGALRVKITALVDFPDAAPGFPTVFASTGAMREAGVMNVDAAPNLLLCRLRNADAVAAVKQAAAPFIGDGSIRVLGRRDLEAQVAGDKLNNFKRQAPLLLTVSVLTALCMLVNGLVVGVEHKTRALALLRAIGMTAWQAAQVIILEGLLIALGGWVIGLCGGWLLLRIFTGNMPETFPEGVMIGSVTPLVSLVGVTVAAALSLCWPCWRVRRIRPLDVLEPHGVAADGPTGGGRRAWLGMALLFPMMALALPLPLTPLARSVLMLAVGIPLHVAGLLLILPRFIKTVERLAAPAVSAALKLDARLLRQRLSLNTARTAAMVLTLSVGLGSYAAIHIWGASMMAPFVPSPEFPDMIVSILPNGIDTEVARKAAELEGVADGRCLPVAAAQFMIADEITERIRQRSGKMPAFSNVLIFGAEPRAAFGGEKPLARFRFVEGERQDAAAELAKGGACVITAMFARESGLGLGGEVSIQRSARGRLDKTAGASGMTVETLRIVGVVDLNWHLVTSRAQMRGRGGMPQGTMGPVFVSEADARRLSGNHDKTSFLWLNLSAAYRAKGALQAGQLLERDMRAALRVGEENTIRAHHRDEIEEGTVARGARLIGDMARAPFWGLVVLSSGIVTLLIASFHASSKTFAVMRAVGMTRGQLGRLLLGEAALTGICGIALSLLSGFCIGWTFTGWTRAWMPFGGLPLSLSVPWLLILGGAGFAFALCVVMAVPLIVWLIRYERDLP